MEQRTLRAAVIGVGSMGRNHARVYASMPGSNWSRSATPTSRLQTVWPASTAVTFTPITTTC